MKIVLYTFSYRKNDVVKNLNNSVTFNNAVLRYPTNHLNPIVRIDLGEITPNNTSYPTYNYAYIEDFGQRYYFIQNITAMSNTIFDLYLHIDVLFTYIGKSNALLRSNYVFVKRNEYNYNALIEDDRVNYEYGLKVTYTELVNTGSAVIDLLNLDSDSRNVMVTCIIPFQTDGIIDGQGNYTNAYYPSSLDIKSIPKEATNFNMGSISYILTYGQARELAFKCLIDDQLKSLIKSFVIFLFGNFSPANSHAVLDIIVKARSCFSEFLREFPVACRKQKSLICFRNSLSDNVGTDIRSEIFGAVIVLLQNAGKAAVRSGRNPDVAVTFVVLE